MVVGAPVSSTPVKQDGAGSSSLPGGALMKRLFPRDSAVLVQSKTTTATRGAASSMPTAALAQEAAKQQRVARHVQEQASENAKEVPGYPGRLDAEKVEASAIARSEYEEDWNREWKLGPPRKHATPPEVNGSAASLDGEQSFAVRLCPHLSGGLGIWIALALVVPTAQQL